ncbi:hypothetical protein [Nodularia sphaerocarpa]|nr:hypothetical protein [Nodularia sphaerocarpa]
MSDYSQKIKYHRLKDNSILAFFLCHQQRIAANSSLSLEYT